MTNRIIVVTGGAGFVGGNLIEKLLKETKFKIISVDNYSSGSIKNHIKDTRVKYIKDSTSNISKILKNINLRFIQFFTLVNFQEYIKVF